MKIRDLKASDVLEYLKKEIQVASQSGARLLSKKLVYNPGTMYYRVMIEDVLVYNGCSVDAAVQHYNKN